MGEIGTGEGTSYPDALDTDALLESTSTLARKDVPNDLAKAIVAVETELGLNPAGDSDDLVARLNAIDDKTKWGTVVLSGGNSQVQVTHGYNGIPSFVIAIPNQNIGNIWITDIGGTTFTINTSASTDTNTTFYWLVAG